MSEEWSEIEVCAFGAPPSHALKCKCGSLRVRHVGGIDFAACEGESIPSQHFYQCEDCKSVHQSAEKYGDVKRFDVWISGAKFSAVEIKVVAAAAECPFKMEVFGLCGDGFRVPFEPDDLVGFTESLFGKLPFHWQKDLLRQLQIKDLKAKVDRVTAQRDEANAKRLEAEDKLHDAMNDAAEAARTDTRRIASLRNEGTQLSRENHKLTDENESLKRQLNEAKRALKEANSKILEQAAEIAELRGAVTDNEDVIEHANFLRKYIRS